MSHWAPYCWHWTASKNHDGYGLYWNGNRQIGAHVFSFFLDNGYYPDGDVCHGLYCERHCVNPRHLHVASHAENIREIHQDRRKLIAEITTLRLEVDRLTKAVQYLDRINHFYEEENKRLDTKVQRLLQFTDELIKVTREQGEERNLLAAAWLQDKTMLSQ